MGPKVLIYPVERLHWGAYGGHGGQIAPISWVRPPPRKILDPPLEDGLDLCSLGSLIQYQNRFLPFTAIIIIAY